MNNTTPTHYKCHPAVRLSYDTSEVEGALRAFGSLEEAARSAVKAVYQLALANIHIIAQNHIYHASEQCGEFQVEFTITSNVFSATSIEYNPDGSPTGIFDGITLEITKNGYPIVVPLSPISQIVCFLSPSIGEVEYIVDLSDSTVGVAGLTSTLPTAESLGNRRNREMPAALLYYAFRWLHDEETPAGISLSYYKSENVTLGTLIFELYCCSDDGRVNSSIAHGERELAKSINAGRLEIEPSTRSMRQGRVVIESLECNFGWIPRNSLRRALAISSDRPEYSTKISHHYNAGVHGRLDREWIRDLVRGGDVGGLGYLLTDGGTRSYDLCYTLAGGGLLSYGLDYILTGSSDTPLIGTGDCIPLQFDLKGGCGPVISLLDQLHFRDWMSSSNRSGTDHQELSPQRGRVTHKTYIDDSMYSMYIASRSSCLGQFGETPRHTPHGS